MSVGTPRLRPRFITVRSAGCGTERCDVTLENTLFGIDVFRHAWIFAGSREVACRAHEFSDGGRGVALRSHASDSWRRSSRTSSGANTSRSDVAVRESLKPDTRRRAPLPPRSRSSSRRETGIRSPKSRRPAGLPLFGYGRPQAAHSIRQGPCTNGPLRLSDTGGSVRLRTLWSDTPQPQRDGDVGDPVDHHIADPPLVYETEQILCRDPQSSGGLRRPERLFVNHDRLPVRRSQVYG